MPTIGVDPIYATVKGCFEHMFLYTEIYAEAVGTGDGTTILFPLAQKKIVDASEIIYVDSVQKTRNTDYTMNYDYGKVTFLTGHIPAAGKAITADYWYSDLTSSTVKTHILTVEDTINRKVGRSFYPAQEQFDILDGTNANDVSFQYYIRKDFSTDAEWYHDRHPSYLKNTALFVTKYPILDVEEVALGSTEVIDEAVGTGDGTTRNFTLDNTDPVSYSEKIYVAGTAKTRDVDYTIDYTSGAILFTVAPVLHVAITANYWYGGKIDRANYRIYPDRGLVVLTENLITHGVQQAFIGYTYGYAAVPATVEHLTEMETITHMMMQRFTGAPVPIDLMKMNLQAVKEDVEELYSALGKKMEVTLI